LDAVKKAVDAAAANGAHPDEQRWEVDPTTLTAVEDAFDESRQLLKVALKAYSVRTTNYTGLLPTSRQVDVTKLDAEMSLATKEDEGRLTSLKEKCSGVRVFHQLCLLSDRPKQKTGNPREVGTVHVTLGRVINGVPGRLEGRIISLASG